MTIHLIGNKEAMSDLEKRFKKAAWLIANGPPKDNASNDEKLKVYGLYKQATAGDNTSSQPWAVQMEARAKVLFFFFFKKRKLHVVCLF